jgi:hypothetical protein
LPDIHILGIKDVNVKKILKERRRAIPLPPEGGSLLAPL